MNEYTPIVMDHFNNPRNVGIINNHDGMGEIGDPNCGDFLRVFIKFEDNIIIAIRYQIRGCPASIAPTFIPPRSIGVLCAASAAPPSVSPIYIMAEGSGAVGGRGAYRACGSGLG